MLVKRDQELVKLYNGEIKKKPVKIKKNKIKKQAFENYMKLFFDKEKQIKVSRKEKFCLRLRAKL